jgi:hypothetical protein
MKVGLLNFNLPKDRKALDRALLELLKDEDTNNYKRAMIQFELPEEEESFQLAIDSVKNAIIIDDFFLHLRNIIKYNPDNFSDEEIEMVEKIRGKFVEIRQQYYD